MQQCASMTVNSRDILKWTIIAQDYNNDRFNLYLAVKCEFPYPIALVYDKCDKYHIDLAYDNYDEYLQDLNDWENNGEEKFATFVHYVYNIKICKNI